MLSQGADGRTSHLLIVHPPIPAPRPSSAPARPLAGGGRASSPALRPPPSPASAGAPSRAPSAQSAEPEAGRQQPSGGGAAASSSHKSLCCAPSRCRSSRESGQGNSPLQSHNSSFNSSWSQGQAPCFRAPHLAAEWNLHLSEARGSVVCDSQVARCSTGWVDAQHIPINVQRTCDFACSRIYVTVPGSLGGARGGGLAVASYTPLSPSSPETP